MGEENARRTALALCALAVMLTPMVTAAPVTESEMEVYNETGCYYNFNHYGEGDRIVTNEPCLNCTCHNRMLMCYLRVCPFTKLIGQDCNVVNRAGDCCPVIECPDVPVDTMSATTSSSVDSTEVGHHDNYGCTIDDKFYADGAKVPSVADKPCELCYCIRNMTACVMQECTLHIEGCTPVYHKGVCCPVRYSCDHPEDETMQLDDMTTTVRPTPGFILTTTMIPENPKNCTFNGEYYADGAQIQTDQPCEHCYCMKGDMVCAVQECGDAMEHEGKNCTAIPPAEGQCCTQGYICEGDETTTEVGGLSTVQPAHEDEDAEKDTIRPIVDEKEPEQSMQTDSPKEEKETERPVEEAEKDTERPVEKQEKETERPSDEEQKGTELPEELEKGTEGPLDEEKGTERPVEEPQKETERPEEEQKQTERPVETTEAQKETAQPEESETKTTLPAEIPDEKETTHEDQSEEKTTAHPKYEHDVTHPDQDQEKETAFPEQDQEKEKYPEQEQEKVTVPAKPEESTHKDEEETTTPSVGDAVTKVKAVKGDDESSEIEPVTEKMPGHEQVEDERPTTVGHGLETQDEITTPAVIEDDSATTPSVSEELRTTLAHLGAHDTSEEDDITESPHSGSGDVPLDSHEQIKEDGKPVHKDDLIPEQKPDLEKDTTEHPEVGDKEHDHKPPEEPVRPEEPTTIPSIHDHTEHPHEDEKEEDEKESITDVPEVKPTEKAEEESTRPSTVTESGMVEDNTVVPQTVKDISKEKEPEAEVDERGEFTTTIPEDGKDKPEEESSGDFELSTSKPSDEFEEKLTTPVKALPEKDRKDTTQEVDEEPHTTPSTSTELPGKVHDDSTPVEQSTEPIDVAITDKPEHPSDEIEPEEILPTTLKADHELEVTTVKDQHVESGTTRQPEVTEKVEEATQPATTEKEGHYEEPSRIPGEGDCLVDGVTYRDNSIVPTMNKCQTSCYCANSILKCERVECPPPPPNYKNCQPVHHNRDACCPTYMCEHQEPVTIESGSQVFDSHTTVPQFTEQPSVTEKDYEIQTEKSTAAPAKSDESTTPESTVTEAAHTTERMSTIAVEYLPDCGPGGCFKDTTKPGQEISTTTDEVDQFSQFTTVSDHRDVPDEEITLRPIVDERVTESPTTKSVLKEGTTLTPTTRSQDQPEGTKEPDHEQPTTLKSDSGQPTDEEVDQIFDGLSTIVPGEEPSVTKDDSHVSLATRLDSEKDMTTQQIEEATEPHSDVTDLPKSSEQESATTSASHVTAEPEAETPAADKEEHQTEGKPKVEISTTVKYDEAFTTIKEAEEPQYTTHTEKSITEAPEKSITEAPEKSITETPEKSITEAPEKSVTDAPEKAETERIETDEATLADDEKHTKSPVEFTTEKHDEYTTVEQERQTEKIEKPTDKPTDIVKATTQQASIETTTMPFDDVNKIGVSVLPSDSVDEDCGLQGCAPKPSEDCGPQGCITKAPEDCGPQGCVPKPSEDCGPQGCAPKPSEDCGPQGCVLATPEDCGPQGCAPKPSEDCGPQGCAPKPSEDCGPQGCAPKPSEDCGAQGCAPKEPEQPEAELSTAKPISCGPEGCEAKPEDVPSSTENIVKSDKTPCANGDCQEDDQDNAIDLDCDNGDCEYKPQKESEKTPYPLDCGETGCDEQKTTIPIEITTQPEIRVTEPSTEKASDVTEHPAYHDNEIESEPCGAAGCGEEQLPETKKPEIPAIECDGEKCVQVTRKPVESEIKPCDSPACAEQDAGEPATAVPEKATTVAPDQKLEEPKSTTAPEKYDCSGDDCNEATVVECKDDKCSNVPLPEGDIEKPIEKTSVKPLCSGEAGCEIKPSTEKEQPISEDITTISDEIVTTPVSKIKDEIPEHDITTEHIEHETEAVTESEIEQLKTTLPEEDKEHDESTEAHTKAESVATKEPEDHETKRPDKIDSSTEKHVTEPYEETKADVTTEILEERLTTVPSLDEKTQEPHRETESDLKTEAPEKSTEVTPSKDQDEVTESVTESYDKEETKSPISHEEPEKTDKPDIVLEPETSDKPDISLEPEKTKDEEVKTETPEEEKETSRPADEKTTEHPVTEAEHVATEQEPITERDHTETQEQTTERDVPEPAEQVTEAEPETKRPESDEKPEPAETDKPAEEPTTERYIPDSEKEKEETVAPQVHLDDRTKPDEVEDVTEKRITEPYYEDKTDAPHTEPEEAHTEASDEKETSLPEQVTESEIGKKTMVPEHPSDDKKSTEKYPIKDDETTESVTDADDVVHTKKPEKESDITEKPDIASEPAQTDRSDVESETATAVPVDITTEKPEVEKESTKSVDEKVTKHPVEHDVTEAPSATEKEPVDDHSEPHKETTDRVTSDIEEPVTESEKDVLKTKLPEVSETEPEQDKTTERYSPEIHEDDTKKPELEAEEQQKPIDQETPAHDVTTESFGTEAPEHITHEVIAMGEDDKSQLPAVESDDHVKVQTDIPDFDKVTLPEGITEPNIHIETTEIPSGGITIGMEQEKETPSAEKVTVTEKYVTEPSKEKTDAIPTEEPAIEKETGVPYIDDNIKTDQVTEKDITDKPDSEKVDVIKPTEKSSTDLDKSEESVTDKHDEKTTSIPKDQDEEVKTSDEVTTESVKSSDQATEAPEIEKEVTKSPIEHVTEERKPEIESDVTDQPSIIDKIPETSTDQVYEQTPVPPKSDEQVTEPEKEHVTSKPITDDDIKSGEITTERVEPEISEVTVSVVDQDKTKSPEEYTKVEVEPQTEKYDKTTEAHKDVTEPADDSDRTTVAEEIESEKPTQEKTTERITPDVTSAIEDERETKVPEHHVETATEKRVTEPYYEDKTVSPQTVSSDIDSETKAPHAETESSQPEQVTESVLKTKAPEKPLDEEKPTEVSPSKDQDEITETVTEPYDKEETKSPVSHEEPEKTDKPDIASEPEKTTEVITEKPEEEKETSRPADEKTTEHPVTEAEHVATEQEPITERDHTETQEQTTERDVPEPAEQVTEAEPETKRPESDEKPEPAETDKPAEEPTTERYIPDSEKEKEETVAPQVHLDDRTKPGEVEDVTEKRITEPYYEDKTDAPLTEPEESHTEPSDIQKETEAPQAETEAAQLDHPTEPTSIVKTEKPEEKPEEAEEPEVSEHTKEQDQPATATESITSEKTTQIPSKQDEITRPTTAFYEPDDEDFSQQQQQHTDDFGPPSDHVKNATRPPLHFTSESPFTFGSQEPSEETEKPDYPTTGHEDHLPQSPDFPGSYGQPGGDEDYDETPFGPGTCRYAGKVYVSAQQIPRDDPCDFCFCFRSDIICLQQSCPPPIQHCHEEPIQGFCCPRYECPVSMATVVNMTTTTTTTTTTLPPHFLSHAYKGAARRQGCQIQGKAYKVGEAVKSASGPCMHCTCGGDGQMKCDPKVCTPEPMLRQMIAAVATSRRR